LELSAPETARDIGIFSVAEQPWPRPSLWTVIDRLADGTDVRTCDVIALPAGRLDRAGVRSRTTAGVEFGEQVGCELSRLGGDVVVELGDAFGDGAQGAVYAVWVVEGGV
jgi:hypothetical protein